MNHTQYLELDFYRTSYRSVKAHQYDKDTRYIIVTCINDAAVYPLDPAAMTCCLKLVTPDGRHLFQTERIQSDGTIMITLEESMLLAAGICKAELNIYELDSHKLLSTMPFDLIVIGSVCDNSLIEESDEFSALTDIIFANNELGDKLEQLENNIEDAESIRAKNEELRDINEENRQAAEALRNSQEAQRENAELTRNDSETARKADEELRQNAEIDRKETFDKLLEAVNTELDKMETANIETVTNTGSYQIKLTTKDGDVSTSPNLLNALRIGEVETGDSEEQPAATITGEFGSQKLNLRLPSGKPFKIEKTYPSIAAMEEDSEHIGLYKFIMINTGNVEDEDTGKLYMKDVSGMAYITDLSGVQGIQGVKGDTGLTPNLAIGTVTTGKPGTQASATLTGTAENPVINLVIPRGETGIAPDTWAVSRNINGLLINGSSNAVNYGVCSTTAATTVKVVPCTGFELITGARITVNFTVTNTAANPALNVNSTGVKPIYYRGAAISANSLAANRTYEFVYNGTQYELVGDLDTNTTYGNMTAATGSEAGKAGLVPAPAAGRQTSFLRGDGTWQNPTSGCITSGTVTKIEKVSSLPSDASNHTDTLYIVV